MKLVLIPTTRFAEDGTHEERETARRTKAPGKRAISGPFYIGACEVTQEEWTAVMEDEPWQDGDYAGNGKESAANYIDYRDAREFCRRLTAKTGMAARLPTEAEWEYACRAGSKTQFFYGDDPEHSELANYAWFRKSVWSHQGVYSHLVGRKKPNRWGLSDVHGNVWEWCANPHEPGSNNGDHCLRGGSFYDEAEDCGCASRLRPTLGHTRGVCGVRIVVPIAIDSREAAPP